MIGENTPLILYLLGCLSGSIFTILATISFVGYHVVNFEENINEAVRATFNRGKKP